jgi:uncharacterized membrane protein YkvA (DUF1232 family)
MVAESLRDRMKRWAAGLKRETHVLVLAYADPRTPLLARVITVLTVAYALSPIDLIPDPIPVLGYLDDLLIVPAGIALAYRLIPDEVLADAREAAIDPALEARLGRWGAGLVIGAWVLAALVIGAIVWRMLGR